MKQKLLTETPLCPLERLVIISYTTGLSFALERIRPLVAIIITVSYLLVLYLFALPNTPKNPFASIYSESLIKTSCQHLLLLVGFNTLIYRKYYDTPPILVGHHPLIWSLNRHSEPFVTILWQKWDGQKIAVANDCLRRFCWNRHNAYDDLGLSSPLWWYEIVTRSLGWPRRICLHGKIMTILRSS
jgi:hypothetical protein